MDGTKVCIAVILLCNINHELHLISSDMVINKQPGGIEVQEEVAPITGLILSQFKSNAGISEISQV